METMESLSFRRRHPGTMGGGTVQLAATAGAASAPHVARRPWSYSSSRRPDSGVRGGDLGDARACGLGAVGRRVPQLVTFKWADGR